MTDLKDKSLPELIAAVIHSYEIRLDGTENKELLDLLAEYKQEIQRKLSQPPAEDPVISSLIHKIAIRSELGISKYGTTLANNPLTTTQWLTHLQEELTDGAAYIERLLMSPPEHTETLKAIRDIINSRGEGNMLSDKAFNKIVAVIEPINDSL